MGMTDPIADMLTRVRNASNACHDVVDVPASKIKVEIAKVLKEEGYIDNYRAIKEKDSGKDMIRINLRYKKNHEKVITGIKRISKPGLRVYAKKDAIPRVLSGLGIAILSTPKGIVTDKKASAEEVGGEVICYVW
ncbi:30S ribosomal protein S8 [Candidatus Oleimmundimicrobium sp.]|uniref:30S ribosomal protein S8 n=1 Tax=Candidatus Oleimmundimicrobium sp. TaxID=3060597 RepID=UPI002724F728|nr:30S ribosomal protein S8 [Candidatus Oleimmundimicrobium sp.]MDO8886049.1 30S ribosomal protein S8 [Candidatus Oleimmundimicrobium sp.]